MSNQPGKELPKSARFMAILLTKGDTLPVITFLEKPAQVRDLVKHTKAQYFEGGYWSLDLGEEAEILFLDPDSKEEAAKLLLFRFIRQAKEETDAVVNP